MQFKVLIVLSFCFLSVHGLIAKASGTEPEHMLTASADEKTENQANILLDPLGLVNSKELVLAIELLHNLFDEQGVIEKSKNELTIRWIMDRFLVGAIEFGMFDAIESFYLFLQDRPLYSPSGRLMLSLFYDGVENMRYFQRAEDWKKLFERMALWQQSYPYSVIAPIVHAMLLEQRAWVYRGNAPAQNISRARMNKFNEYIGKADAFLEQHKALANSDAQWYALKVRLLRAQGKAKPEQLSAILVPALTLFPDYDRLHFNLVLSQFPNWGGSAERIDFIIAQVLNYQTNEQDKQMIYTRMYWIAKSAYFRTNIFNDAMVDWPRMKQGYQLIIEEYPDDWNLNHFAATACLAGDLTTMATLLPRITRYYRAAWFGDDAFHQRCVELTKV